MYAAHLFPKDTVKIIDYLVTGDEDLSIELANFNRKIEEVFQVKTYQSYESLFLKLQNEFLEQ